MTGLNPVAPSGRSRIAIRMVALTPLWVFLVLVAAGSFTSYFGPPPPAILGIPLDTRLIALVAGWMLIGVGLVWDARSRLTEMLAFLLFTIPATIVLVLGPALILILQNLML